ncbi:hypothetical protein AFCDBAGC_4889 [Methylobacterium cerastii]|uniref:Uncharacterized protein n=1 Tax=Methylobacterium cerastii TaxID=932741 RepID=A0ABQ4QPR1_9HYPH|nr:hypothetical protein [Methylobacterium cerastii]GJD47004.1 hypothetical protein AFCDBAGC_4889 [Methylobacterium cerastii]
MANNVLREFLVSVGFKVDEVGAKRQQEALARTEKQLAGLEKTEKEAHAAGGKRAVELAQRAESMATAARVAGAGVAAFALAAGAALAAIAGHLRSSLGEFDRYYYVAGRTGASVNNIKALGHAFEQTGSSASRAMGMLESFSKARRTNPGVDGLIRSLGVSTKGDSSEVLGNALDAAKAKNPYFTAAQIAQQFGITEEDYEHFTRYRKEIQNFQGAYKALQKTMGVDGNETAAAAARISRAFGSLHAVTEVLGDKLTQVLAPVIERVVNAFRDWIAANPERVEAILRKIGDALEAVGKWLSKKDTWDGFADFWSKLYTGVERVVTIVSALLEALYKLGNIFNSGPIKKYFDFMFGGGIAGQLFGGSAQAAGGGSGGGIVGAAANDTGAEKPGLMRRGWNAVKRAVGVSGSDTGSTQARAPGAPGRYRPVYSLGDADLDQRVVNKIAGEAIANNSESVDAVVNNMLNRVGSEGWGPSGNLMEVALARGQYAGNRAAGAKESEFIRSRIKAIASGGMPDNTNGSNAYRAAWYAGPWGRKHAADGRVVGGNRFAYEPETPNGPYKPYTTPRDVPTASAPAFRPGSSRMSPGGFDLNAYLGSQPMGSTSNSTDMSRTLNNNAPVTVNVQGANDPAATASAVARGVSAAGDMNIRNVQTALR